MFTGLVEAMGVVEAVEPDGAGGSNLRIAWPAAGELAAGESVAVNGACLTAVRAGEGSFDVQAGPETLAKTNLGRLTAGDAVNLERSLRAGDRLGGHFVLGHVDAYGTVKSRDKQGDWEMIWFACPPALTRQMVAKGSVAVDGVSLTLVEVTADAFLVMLIPHTLGHTTIGRRAVGDSVNLETDILAKHVEKMLGKSK